MGEDLRGRVLGEFELIERIGDGGFGAVYLAYQPRLERDVVVKVLHRPLRNNPDAEMRFLREAKLASRLDHPNAAHVHMAGWEQSDDLLWIAMEYVKGVTLKKWIDEHGPMQIDEFVPFAEKLAGAIDAAHAAKIVHRDIKPENVMVQDLDGQRSPKLLDFGIAKPIDAVLANRLRYHTPVVRPLRPSQPSGSSSWTSAGTALGSFQFMPPEQWLDPRAVGPAADLYAFAVLAYKALTGRLPFDVESAEQVAELAELHRSAQVPPVGPGLPSTLDAVFRVALAKRPEDRFASATEFASALRAVRESRMSSRVHDAAEEWQRGRRRPELLWRGSLLAEFEEWIRDPSGNLTPLDHEFVEASRTAAQMEAEARSLRKARVRLAAAAAVVFVAASGLTVTALLQRLSNEEARAEQEKSEAKVTAAELEQGRAAVLHGENDEAVQHLTEAWRRGERSPATEFMLTRALQSKLAELASFEAISGRMWSGAWRPDGQQLVTTDDGGAQVWDARTHQLLISLPGDRVYSAVYNADGTRLITAAWDGVRIWNATAGSLIRELRNFAHPKHYFIGASTPDGRLAAALSTTGDAVDVWDTATGKLLAELTNDVTPTRWTLTFSADGRWLATSSGDHVKLFETATWHPITIPVRHVLGLSFDPHGPRIATATGDGGAVIWSLPDGGLVRRLRESGEPIEQIIWSADGRLLAIASHDGTEQVWRAASGERVSQGNYLHDPISSMEFDPTGKLLLVAGAKVVVSDAEHGIMISTFDEVQRLARFAPRGQGYQAVLGVALEGTAKIWDARSPYRRFAAPPVGSGCGVLGGADPDGRFVVVACPGHPTRVWDTARDLLLAELPPVYEPGGDFAVPFPVVSVTGRRAAIARGNAAEIYELPGGSLARSVAHQSAVTAVALGAGGELVSGDASGEVMITRADREDQAIASAGGGIDAIVILPNGSFVATDATRHLRVIDGAGATIASVGLPERMGILRPSPEGRRLITLPNVAIPSQSGSIGPALLWDLEAGRLVSRLVGHRGRTVAARWVAGEVLTAGGDGTVRRWDGLTGQERKVYQAPRGLSDVALGQGVIVAGDTDGMLHFWDIQSGDRLWMLKAHTSCLAGLHFEGADLVTRGFGGDVSRWEMPEASKAIEVAVSRGIVVP